MSEALDLFHLFKAIKWEVHFQTKGERLLSAAGHRKYVGTPKARAMFLWGMNPQLYGELEDRLPQEFHP